MAHEQIETVIIGGGQAGLAMSYHLGQLGHEHVILERQRVGERWRSERWDSFTFQFPNWSMQLPGYDYKGAAPDDFAHRDEVVSFIEGYANMFRAPLRCGALVISIRQKTGSPRFHVQTEGTTIEAVNVVIATGPYQKPAIPLSIKGEIRDAYQVHSSSYRNPEQLPPGAVVVIGSGASGCQIAEDLLHSGRRVYLSVGRYRPVPRRYRGRDFYWWEVALGGYDRTEDQEPKRLAPLLTGVGGGHDVDLRRLARDGLVPLGRVVAARESKLALAPDVGAVLARGEELFAEFVKSADDYAQRSDLDPPDEDWTRERLPDPREVVTPIRELDLNHVGITSVVWASGFGYDFGWVDLPILSETGNGSARRPIHRRGVAAIPGLYFIGLQWLSRRKSSLMAGVGEDAAFLAEHIVTRTAQDTAALQGTGRVGGRGAEDRGLVVPTA